LFLLQSPLIIGKELVSSILEASELLESGARIFIVQEPLNTLPPSLGKTFSLGLVKPRT
jgi:hypothetical protein